MADESLADRWATRFGLAQAPLFEPDEVRVDGRHDVLLDGGDGSFALSESDEPIWRDATSADWSWSSDLPHHVTVTSQEVAVVRWDKDREEVFSRSSVERRLETFYDYLARDKVQSNRRVVDFMVSVFRRVRALVADAGLPDWRSVDAYLGVLAQAMMRRESAYVHTAPGATLNTDALGDLSQGGVERILRFFDDPWARGHPPLKVHPVLAVRHAGSEVFQEAHFDLLRSRGPDLFGDLPPAESDRRTRGGAHFTPPALARSLVELALAEVRGLHGRDQLLVLDPACGSGVFLHEVLRTLRRLGYDGTVRLIGWDNSAPAISMARFVLESAREKWSPAGGMDIQLEVLDSLDTPFPRADLIVMNPPFVSWPAMRGDQRDQVSEVLGRNLKGRADLCMAFLTKAVGAVTSGGAVGSLMPASLLTSWAADAWRKSLLDEADVAFLSSLGDFGLFIHAMVQVAATVFSKRQEHVAPRESAVALVSGNDRIATGNALRELRKVGSDVARGEAGWHIFPINVPRLRQRPTWRLVPPDSERVLAALLDSGRALQVRDLFNVRQGVLTGKNSVFVLKRQERNVLPEAEQRWFREAIASDSITRGAVETSDFVFYPYGTKGLELRTEDEVAEAVPEYYRMYLRPNRDVLAARPAYATRPDWWALERPRGWERERAPRIASKYFGGRGGFAPDVGARYVVVQGYAWIPTQSSYESLEGAATSGHLERDDYLCAYAAILNSSLFHHLLGIYSPQVSGGQFNLGPRFVHHVPVPDLVDLASDDELIGSIWRLATLCRGEEQIAETSFVAIDELAARLYGLEWPIESTGS